LRRTRFKQRAQGKFHYRCTRCSFLRSSASLTLRMLLMETTPVHSCGAPCLMDATPSSTAHIREFLECDVIFRLRVLFVYVWISSTPCLRAGCRQRALPRSSLCRIRCHFFCVLHLSSTWSDCSNMHLLPDLSPNIISASFRRTMAFFNKPRAVGGDVATFGDFSL
jgi:hypothetical protein